jgi:hypothetical protein
VARQSGEFTAWQLKVLETYGGGDYHERYADMAEFLKDDRIGNVGDGLLSFLMIELDPGEDCDSWAEAARRMAQIIGNVEDVQDAIDKAMPDEDEDEDGD